MRVTLHLPTRMRINTANKDLYVNCPREFENCSLTSAHDKHAVLSLRGLATQFV